MDIDKKRKKEKEVVSLMIHIYCNRKHKTKKNLCDNCRDILDYTSLKVDKCPMMEKKSFCSACKIQCYSQEMREKVRAVMKYSGPKMLLYHPLLVLQHMIVAVFNNK